VITTVVITAPVELEGTDGNEVDVVGIGGNNEVDGKTGTVKLAGGGPT
jgi:hypothetical protein